MCIVSKVVSKILVFVVLLSTYPAMAEDAPPEPGPCLELRASIRKAIKDAEAHNIGVKPYVDALASIEEEIKAGKTEGDVAPRLKSLKSSLYTQFMNYRALKSGGAGAVSGADLKRLANKRYLPESQLESIMLTLVNNDRKKAGAPLLGRSSALASIAKAHSRDMLANNYTGHEGAKGSIIARCYAAGVNPSGVYENVAHIYCKGMALDTIKSAHKEFLNSPTHNKNVMAPERQSIGIGVCYDKTFSIKVTQVIANDDI